MTLADIIKEYSNNRSIVTEAVMENGNNLKHASGELKNDYSIVLQAVKQNGLSIEFASDALKNNFVPFEFIPNYS